MLYQRLLDALSAADVLNLCHPNEHPPLNPRGLRLLGYLRQRERRSK